MRCSLTHKENEDGCKQQFVFLRVFWRNLHFSALMGKNADDAVKNLLLSSTLHCVHIGVELLGAELLRGKVPDNWNCQHNLSPLVRGCLLTRGISEKNKQTNLTLRNALEANANYRKGSGSVTQRTMPKRLPTIYVGYLHIKLSNTKDFCLVARKSAGDA